MASIRIQASHEPIVSFKAITINGDILIHIVRFEYVIDTLSYISRVYVSVLICIFISPSVKGT